MAEDTNTQLCWCPLVGMVNNTWPLTLALTILYTLSIMQ